MEELTLGIAAAWARMVGKVKRDKGTGAYHRTPAMSTVSE